MFDIMERKRQFEARREHRGGDAASGHYLDAYLAHMDDPPVLREAYALSAYWLNAELELYPEELIAGMIRSAGPAGFHYGSGTYVSSTAEGTEPVKQRCYQCADPSFVNARELAYIESRASTSTWFGGHMVLDYETILRIGLSGYRDEIRRHERTAFYKAMEITLDATKGFILRLADMADALHTADAPDTPSAPGAESLSGTLRHIAAHPPKTFRQALQLVWILHYLDNSDSFGRFDVYLLPFYERDISTGVLNRVRAAALLTDFWLKIEDAEQIQNMTLGGTDENGRPSYSDLTLLCLEITEKLRYKGPNLSLRVTQDIPENIWNAALGCIASGTGLPALYNDGAYTESLVRSGIPLQTAGNYCFAGCSQLMIPGQSNFYNDIGMLNAAKIAEITLYDGYDPYTGRQVGPHTGRAEDFADFDSLLAAFFRQLEDACAVQTQLHDKETAYRASREGYALRSLFTRDCLQRGLGIFEGGARYNNLQLELIGITNAADMLYAVRAAVFEDCRLSLPDLCALLRSDWENAPDMQAYFRSLPKFGNGHPGVDSLRARISAFLYGRFNRTPGPLGGVYMPGEVIFTAHEHCGTATGATPDGRSAGEVLADSAGAAGGCAREGPTALMNSVLSLPVRGYLLTSVVLNMRFMPQLFQGSALKGLSAMLLGFFSQGGTQLQINVCDGEALKKAQQDPAGHKDLIVRVGGYSDYFVRLSPALQNEIIARTEFMA